MRRVGRISDDQLMVFDRHLVSPKGSSRVNVGDELPHCHRETQDMGVAIAGKDVASVQGITIRSERAKVTLVATADASK